jgi:deazaflavin-dependent oxidoreductase (nitroreductase family)
MTTTFHMTRSMRAGTAMLTTLLRAGAPMGPLMLLTVAGRKSGKLYTTPVALVERPEARWLVAAFGEVNWVRNLRAANTALLRRGRRRETITAVELAPAEAAPVLKQFLTSYQLVPFFLKRPVAYRGGDGDSLCRAVAPGASLSWNRYRPRLVQPPGE